MVWKQLMQNPNPIERSVFEALDDPRWSWRTLAGLRQTTHLTDTEIMQVIDKHRDLVRVGTSEKYGTIFQLAFRTEPPEEKFVEKVLDYMSMGRRKIA